MPQRRGSWLHTLSGSTSVISGPAGERDWIRHASHFTDSARLTVLHREANGNRPETLSVGEYQASRDPFFRNNTFFETEVSCDVIVSGDVAHAMSCYESRWNEADAPFETGVNSIQFARIHGSWKITPIMWVAGDAASRVAAQGYSPR